MQLEKRREEKRREEKKREEKRREEKRREEKRSWMSVLGERWTQEEEKRRDMDICIIV